MKFIMNFLRSPFQFRSSDQPNRKVGTDSPVVENMFIDPTTGLPEDPKWRAVSPGIGASSSIAGSPRLQHRVPGFGNNGNPSAEVVQGTSSEDSEKSQRVRVVPIKVESVDDSSVPKKRSNVFHSNSGTIPRSNQFSPLHPGFEDLTDRKRHSSGPSLHKKSDLSESKPKVCNIPIFVEGRDTPVVPKRSPSSQYVPVDKIPSPKAQSVVTTQNGGGSSKCSTKPKQDEKTNVCVISLKQITDVLTELQPLKTAVDEFKGIPQDKQYRYLDEMLTRCMLKLDDVETHGNNEVRAARKAAIKAVQECINDLESHAQTNAKSIDSLEMDKTEEKSLPPDTAEVREMCERDQKATEAVGEASNVGNASVGDKFAVKESGDDQMKSLSLKRETGPTASKSRDLVAGHIESEEVSVTKDENSNLEEYEDGLIKPMEVEEIKAAADEIDQQERAHQSVGEFETSKQLAASEQNAVDSVVVTVAQNAMEVEATEAAIEECEEMKGTAEVRGQPGKLEEHETSTGLEVEQRDPVYSVEQTDVLCSVSPENLSKQNEPMKSQVPEETIDSEMIEHKGEVMDSEMVELAKKPFTSEPDKDTPVLSEINN